MAAEDGVPVASGMQGWWVTTTGCSIWCRDGFQFAMSGSSTITPRCNMASGKERCFANLLHADSSMQQAAVQAGSRRSLRHVVFHERVLAVVNCHPLRWAALKATDPGGTNVQQLVHHDLCPQGCFGLESLSLFLACLRACLEVPPCALSGSGEASRSSTRSSGKAWMTPSRASHQRRLRLCQTCSAYAWRTIWLWVKTLSNPPGQVCRTQACPDVSGGLCSSLVVFLC